MPEYDLEGQTLGEYEVRARLALGSMSTVYEAYQHALDRLVALRVLNSKLAENPQYVKAFRHEAALLARLEHPHILPIHSYGQERGCYYMALRLMRGGSLKDKVGSSGGLPLPECSTLTRQMASALDFVHQQGLVNGELSRANILFDGWGNPYIGNLFFAGLTASEEERLAWSYAAPERWHGAEATPASDQYAFGVVAYYMLAGEKPFQGRGNKLREQHLSVPPPAPQTHRPDAPLAVNAVLNRALAKQASERYPTVMDFARAFEEALRATPQHVFISYSRRDKDYARRLADDLTGSSFKVWIDDQIDYGDAWFREIDKAINGCAAFVVIMTPDAYESEWVQKEILLAKRYKKPIFPLLLKGDEFAILIDIQFGDVKDGALPPADFYRRLRRAVYGEG
jgi:serine/threonine protein kinase